MEIHILDMIQNLRTPIGDVVVPLITRLGDAGIIWIILTVLLLIIPKTRNDGGIAGGCVALQCGHKESGGKNQTIRCQYSSTITGRKAAGLLFPVGAYECFFCGSLCISQDIAPKMGNSLHDSCRCDRPVKVVCRCPLSK